MRINIFKLIFRLVICKRNRIQQKSILPNEEIDLSYNDIIDPDFRTLISGTTDGGAEVDKKKKK